MHKFYIDPKKLKLELLEIEKEIPKNVPVMIHSDILEVGFPCETFSPENAGEMYEKIFMEVFGQRPVLFPTFNYDYCSKRVYDVERDLGQVGFLSKYMAQTHPNFRSRTPVFNYVILNNDTFSLDPSKEAFGVGSVFEQFFSRNGYVILLGVGILRCTPLMYVEAQRHCAYRYNKKFPGVIQFFDQSVDIDFSMPVRPLNPDIVDYSDILQVDMLHEGIMKEFSVGFSTAMTFESHQFFVFFSAKLDDDPFYPLTEKSKQECQSFVKSNGPFTFEAFETVK